MTVKQKQSAQLAFNFSIEEKIKLQERAIRKVQFIPMDKRNIAETMPLLLEHQIENVFKAENRFFGPPGEDGLNKGILFTDNTGSGKTYTALGIAKRFEMRGMKDLLIVVPTDAKCKDWADEARRFGIFLYQLKDTKDAGAPGSQVVTTYANFRANLALLTRVTKKPFHLIIYDESHKIVSNEAGSTTQADDFHKRISFAPDQAYSFAFNKYAALAEKAKNNYQETQKIKQMVEDEAKRLVDATKVVFLSATPFSYHKNLKYADGYLFTITQGLRGTKQDVYNQFYVNNFGYRILYHKLTEPDAKVDVGLFERQFHTKLWKAGAVSSTRLKLDRDYSREFVLIDDKTGMLIDEGYELASDHNTYKWLPQVINEKFNYLYKTQLLECIKAKRSIERIKQHLDLGRKVFIFHSYLNSLPSHPFDLSDTDLWPKEIRQELVRAEIESFHKKYPQFRALDLSDLSDPITTITEAFGEKVVLFNGRVSTKERTAVKKQFNDDNSGKDIIMLQMEAGKEGVSLHDTTGVHQRVGINLGLPLKPSDVGQWEGRGYRIGQMSDCIIEYPVLHLNFEKSTFSEKINERAKTVENLAFGEQARNIKEALKEGYKNPISDDPHNGQGKGSRDADFIFDTIAPYDLAIKLYFNRGKRTARTKSKEGVDYFATAEPIGLKKVEWLYTKPNDHLLEPSAGHGAIARFFPEDTVNKLIEPSNDLRADLSINVNGAVMGMRFEDYHIVNKFHGIAMNPPFGTAGKTAMDHFEKAVHHLYDGGRIVITLPDGPAMDTRLEKWKTSQESKNLFIVGEVKLPGCAFERAGTFIRTKILVIDKQTTFAAQKALPKMVSYDFSHIEDVNELFEELKDLSMPARLRGATEQSTIVQTVAGVHTKFGYKIWTVRFLGKFSNSTFDHASKKAAELGGYYSSYNGNNAIPGFIFKGVEGSDNAKRLELYVNSAQA